MRGSACGRRRSRAAAAQGQLSLFQPSGDNIGELASSRTSNPDMQMLADARHALRLLARSPIFTVSAVLSLALGVSASTTIFSLADALLLSPSAGVRNPSEVVDIGRSNEGEGFDNMSHPTFKYLRDHTTTLAAMSAVEFGGGPMGLSENGNSERITGTMVSASYFDVLGTRPAIGRFFLPTEDAVAGARPVVVLSHAFWRRRFASDPGVLQKPVRLNNHEFTVVGVAERRLRRADVCRHRPVGADLDGGRGARPGEREHAHRAGGHLAHGGRAVEARSWPGAGAGGAEHAHRGVQGRGAAGQQAAPDRRGTDRARSGGGPSALPRVRRFALRADRGV